MNDDHAPRTTAPPPQQSKVPILAAVGVVVVVLAVVVIVGSRNSDSDKTSTTSNGVKLEEVRAVTVSGPVLPEQTDQVPDPAIGKTIPTVEGASLDGTPVRIANNGRAKVLMFVAHWSEHCQKEVPLITSYLGSNPAPQGVELLTVSTNASSGSPNYPPSRWLEKEKWPLPTLADDSSQSVANAFGLASFPYFVAVDASGKVVGRTSGAIPMTEFAGLITKAMGTS